MQKGIKFYAILEFLVIYDNFTAILMQNNGATLSQTNGAIFDNFIFRCYEMTLFKSTHVLDICGAIIDNFIFRCYEMSLFKPVYALYIFLHIYLCMVL